jgi:serine/threonine-protein kinase
MKPMPPDRDCRLAELIDRLTDDQRAGRPVNVDGFARAHPDLAAELRELWAVAQFAQCLSPTRNPRSGVVPSENSGARLIENPQTRRANSSFGDFELLEELGRGGMGVVYKARQKSLDRLVATDDDRARFRIEAHSAAQLKHPNIVTVYEVGTTDGQAYICMEFVGGPTLAQRVASDGPLPPREAARLVAIIARAVQHAHSEGILHRDLKPSNVLLVAGTSGRHEPAVSSFDREATADARRPLAIEPKISDFGLAKKIDSTHSLTRTGAVLGTPSYMAPEQAGGRKDLTPAADVYSLGAILYELLTGRPPHQASHPVDTLLLVLEQEPVPPRSLNPTVDRELEMICLKCLQKPVELRYSSAAALAADLEAYAAGETISAQPSGLRFFLARMFRETHHADVLENWGKLWMMHSVMIFLLCLLTQAMAWSGVTSHFWFLGIWSVGLVTWGTIFWQLRRRAGPVLFVERQIAHAWAAGVCFSIAMFVIEWLAGLPVLTLSPAVAAAAAMIFVFKAGILSGKFYLWAGLTFLTACIMPLVPNVAVLLFGAVSAVSFFVPGLIYYRQRRAGEKVSRERQRESAGKLTETIQVS